jgi:ubiquinone/menaquinone biosynthesis C-methylase UbiE
LVPDKAKVFSEIKRVLKPGGHFSISDVVLEGPLPEKFRNVAELYAGCISGAIQQSEYLSIIEKTGFVNVQVQKSKPIVVPDEILAQYLSAEEIKEFKQSSTGIFSITVYGEKDNCCTPGKGCC